MTNDEINKIQRTIQNAIKLKTPFNDLVRHLMSEFPQYRLDILFSLKILELKRKGDLN